jgi:UDP-glucuronate 4-epimerase
VRYAYDHPEEYVDTNIKGFFNVIDEVRLQNIDGLIYASTSSVYGGNDTFPSSENDMVDNQVSLYGMNKKANENMAHVYHALYGTKVTGLRFFTVYGPYGRPDMALFLFTDSLHEGRETEGIQRRENAARLHVRRRYRERRRGGDRQKLR